MYGPESCGKTTLALHAVAEVQKAGGVATFIDVEHALDTDYAAALGVDMAELYIAQPQSGEQALEIMVSQRHPAHCFSAVLRPFCAVLSPFFCAVWLPGAETERTGEKWRKMGEIWGRNGRETAVAEWRWGQEHHMFELESLDVPKYRALMQRCADAPSEPAASLNQF